MSSHIVASSSVSSRYPPPRPRPHPRPEAFPRDPASADAPAPGDIPRVIVSSTGGASLAAGPIGVCPRPPPPRGHSLRGILRTRGSIANRAKRRVFRGGGMRHDADRHPRKPRVSLARLRQERVHRSRQVIRRRAAPPSARDQKRTADARRTARRTARRRVVSCRTRIGTSASGGARRR